MRRVVARTRGTTFEFVSNNLTPNEPLERLQLHAPILYTSAILTELVVGDAKIYLDVGSLLNRAAGRVPCQTYGPAETLKKATALFAISASLVKRTQRTRKTADGSKEKHGCAAEGDAGGKQA